MKYIYIREITHWDYYIKDLYALIDSIQEKCITLYTTTFYNVWDAYDHETYIEHNEYIYVYNLLEEEYVYNVVEKYLKDTLTKKQIEYLTNLLIDLKMYYIEGYEYRGDGIVYVLEEEIDYLLIDLENDEEFTDDELENIKEVIYKIADELNNKVEVYETDKAYGYSQGDVEGIIFIYVPKEGKEEEIKNELKDFNKLFKRFFTFAEFEKVEIEIDGDDINEDVIREKGMEKIEKGEYEIINEDEINKYIDEDNVVIDFIS